MSVLERCSPKRASTKENSKTGTNSSWRPFFSEVSVVISIFVEQEAVILPFTNNFFVNTKFHST